MFKIIRFTKLFFKAISKPASKTLYRIPQITQVIGDEHKHEFHFQYNYRNYQKQLTQKHEEILKLRTSTGLSELAKINAQLIQQNNYVRFAGDYAPYGNPEQFIHALQFYRSGAQQLFYTIDELETIKSEYISDSEIEFHDSQIIQHS